MDAEQRRLEHLWRASWMMHGMNMPDVAMECGRALLEHADAARVELHAGAVRAWFCARCSSLMVPGRSCAVRKRRRRPGQKVVKVVYRCSTCGFANVREAPVQNGWLRARKKKRASADAGVRAAAAAAAGGGVGGGTGAAGYPRGSRGSAPRVGQAGGRGGHAAEAAIDDGETVRLDKLRALRKAKRKRAGMGASALFAEASRGSSSASKHSATASLFNLLTTMKQPAGMEASGATGSRGEEEKKKKTLMKEKTKAKKGVGEKKTSKKKKQKTTGAGGEDGDDKAPLGSASLYSLLNKKVF